MYKASQTSTKPRGGTFIVNEDFMQKFVYLTVRENWFIEFCVPNDLFLMNLKKTPLNISLLVKRKVAFVCTRHLSAPLLATAKYYFDIFQSM